MMLKPSGTCSMQWLLICNALKPLSTAPLQQTGYPNVYKMKR